MSTMTAEASAELADSILAAAGWRVLPDQNRFCFEKGGNRIVGGIQPDGQAAHAKNIDWRKPGDPLYSADTPDEYHEAAAWLVERFKPNPLSLDSLIEPPQSADHGQDADSDRPDDGAGAGEDASLSGGLSGAGDGQTGEDGPGRDGALAGDAAGAAGPVIPLDAVFPEREDDALDADFTESAGDAYDQDVTLALEGPEGELSELDYTPEPEDFAPDDLPPQPGPIAYAASDLDALVREKLGRVSQIARELKAILQEGWTLGEFASLQNLIVRIDRGEAADDAEARARFQAISERSQAMSRVDAHRDALETALAEIGKSRDYAAAVAFDPEAGWPGEML